MQHVTVGFLLFWNTWLLAPSCPSICCVWAAELISQDTSVYSLRSKTGWGITVSHVVPPRDPVCTWELAQVHRLGARTNCGCCWLRSLNNPHSQLNIRTEKLAQWDPLGLCHRRVAGVQGRNTQTVPFQEGHLVKVTSRKTSSRRKRCTIYQKS